MTTINNKNNKIYSYIIILISLFILVLFTKSQFEKIQVSLDEKNIEQSNLENARNKVQRLNDTEAKLAKESDIVAKYTTKFSEDELISYIYWEIEKQNMWWENWIVSVRSLSIQEWLTNELWFNESNIILNLRVPSVERMKSTLDFFISEDSKYKFFIDSFNVPTSTPETWFNISIPLKVFYK